MALLGKRTVDWDSVARSSFILLLSGLSIWFAWGHQLFHAIWPALLGWAFATRRNDE